MKQKLQNFQLSLVYKSLFDYNPNASYVLDTQGSFIIVNDATFTLTGRTEDELLSMNFIPLIREDHLEVTLMHFNEALQGKQRSFDTVILHKDGRSVDLRVIAVPILIQGEIHGVIGIAEDVTEKNKIQKELLVSKSQLQNMFNSLDVCVWTLDKESYTFKISPACEEIYGVTVKEFQEDWQIWRSFIHPEDQEEIESRYQEVLGGQSWTSEYRIISRDGKTKWLYNYVMPIKDEMGNIIRFDGVVTDISGRRKIEEDLHVMAFQDALTGLPNRRMFNKRLEKALKRAKKCNTKLAVMYLDLDRFKFINDSLGHQAGDRLLQLVSKRLTETMDDRTVISRQGGDEFSILIENVKDIQHIESIAKSLLHIITKPLQLEGYEYILTTSIGVSIYPDHADTADGLIKRADQAMYRAKESGKSNFKIYNPGMTQDLSRMMQVEQALHKALERNELSLYYQPIVDTCSSQINGFEALIRWKHAEWGFISPAEFIPIAEESSLIVPIGEWILQTACIENKKWRENGFPNTYVSVNISARQFEQDRFVQQVERILQETDMEPHYLRMEITETASMKNVENMIVKLNKLKDLGIQVVLDDFGTGYSSLSYLQKLPIKALKIDQSFIRGINQDSNQEAIVKTIIGMTKGLKMNVIAEGVEQKQQLEFLQELGCYKMQGYLFSKPIPLSAFAQLHDNRSI
ncbi:EAL domain-containing protein [Ectobacillus sp. JY-23]|uniref:sensor domain-containing protein n=1 Tax=Ectobacillus sp. JY-23 TaxID=2933872 RepID=UPI001FF1EF34|nr:EAL domain-containing protein [Ectobacillus sp. JY-23]UOY91788.1 EAL domain-containing protein [Ectobacillus sp. JY-23]